MPAVKLGKVTDDPFINTVGEQQDFDAFLAEDFEMWAVLGSIEGIGRNV